MEQVKLLLALAALASADHIEVDYSMHEANGQSRATFESASTRSSGLPDGWDELSRLNPNYVIFGEIHGTKEAPGLVGLIACALARQGKRVLVAVELGAPDNTNLQEAWQSSETTFKTRLLRSGWSDRSDGVSSTAMLDLLADLHSAKISGNNISVVAFNGFRDDKQERRLSTLPGSEAHEAAQAENIRAAAKNGAYDIVLVLVGAAHARKFKISHGGEIYRPMAMFLSESGKVITLRMVTSGGTAWNCILKPGVRPVPQQPINESMIDCGNHPYKGLRNSFSIKPIGLGRVPGMHDDAGYDGYFWLGSVSGSSPASQ